ncbi:MAG: NifB/NifX family molybdenum-iron cluster-binding protein [Pseudomonadota bacterium]
MRIAVPSEAPGGLDAQLSPHFGHCAFFTLVDTEGDEVKGVEVLPNMPHAQGGCMAPVMYLAQHGVERLVAGGMGMRPLMGFQQVGIQVHFHEGAEKVSDAVGLLLAGQARIFGPAQTCGGGGGCHH